MSLTTRLHTRCLSLLAGCVAAGLIALLAIYVALPVRAVAAQGDTPVATATETLAPTATQTLPPTAIPSATPTLAAPTLVPPTPLPTLTATPFTPPTESGLAAIQRDRVLRVGTYFNAYPFAWLNEQGVVTGYEIEILEAIGIELGIELEFTQVTRHNALDMLLSGQVDVLVGQQIHTRDRESLVDFTHPYYANAERMVVLTGAPYVTLRDLAGQPVAVEIGSRSERALHAWSEGSGVNFDVRPFLTESAALDALANGEVQGMVGVLDSLRRAGRQGMRLIDEPVLNEYYAITIRRWDVNLRDVLNRSLQRLKASGRLEEIHSAWFAGDGTNFDLLVPVYERLYEDQRALADFPTDAPVPDRSVAERLRSGQPLRVAGVVPLGQDAPALIATINALNRALVEEMARRWNAQIEYLPDSAQGAAALVAGGQADLAVGVSPAWDATLRVEYSLPYLTHGDRLMVAQPSQITSGFADMLGTGWWIGYFADEPADADLIRRFAEMSGVSANINEPFAIQREDDAIYTLTVGRNVDAIFGDSLRLLGLVREAGETGVKILPTQYGDNRPIAFAVPHADADFRALVDATLQDMALDGTFQTLWATHFGEGEPLPILFYAPTSPDAPLD
ncbi:MAG: transporter substrate-binding domain-containing protein [Anaerolineae bacterium]|nr:transporter substrate-binding domain-containing protein [Anaerolineae bacterium]